MAKWKVYFNRGCVDPNHSWVIEGESVQITVAKVKLSGATAETQFAPHECPKGYFIVSGELKITDSVAEFLQ
jgi:hypothetical protein